MVCSKRYASQYPAAPHDLTSGFCFYIIALTTDKAATNDVIACAVRSFLMRKLCIHFTCDNGQINCVTHIVNLVVQAILAALDEADDPDVIDYFNKDLPIHYDANEDEVQQNLECEEFGEDDKEIEEEEEEEEEAAGVSWEELSALKKVRIRKKSARSATTTTRL